MRSYTTGLFLNFFFLIQVVTDVLAVLFLCVLGFNQAYFTICVISS